MISDNLQVFVGKVCTVLTHPTTRQYPRVPQDKQFDKNLTVEHAQYFTGQVTDVDNYGIWLKHLHTKQISFYQFPIIGIVEEQYITEKDPMMDKIKKDIEKAKKPPTPVYQTFIPIDDLTKLV